MDTARVESLIRELLDAIGDDPYREGLAQTPARVASLCETIFSGTGRDLASCLHPALPLPESRGSASITLNGVPFYSVCEHHLVPFFGVVNVSCIPNGLTIGLGDVVHLVNVAAARLQIQERLTAEIAETLFEHLTPQAVAVCIVATHLCMDMRRDTRTRGEFCTSYCCGDPESGRQLLANVEGNLARGASMSAPTFFAGWR